MEVGPEAWRSELGEAPPPVEASPPRHLVALAVLGGWALHDFALFFAGPEPHLLRELLPGTVLAITAGVLVVGVLGMRESWLALAVLVLGGLVLGPRLTGGAPLEPRWPLRLVAATATLVLAAGRLAPRLGRGPNALGLALGAGTAALLGLWRGGTWPAAYGSMSPPRMWRWR